MDIFLTVIYHYFCNVQSSNSADEKFCYSEYNKINDSNCFVIRMIMMRMIMIVMRRRIIVMMMMIMMNSSSVST